jgi:hypothetical protein
VTRRLLVTLTVAALAAATLASPANAQWSSGRRVEATGWTFLVPYDVAGAGDRAVIAWIGKRDTRETRVVRVRVVRPGGTMSPPVTVSEKSEGSPDAPSVGIDSRGAVVVAWTAKPSDSDFSHDYVRRRSPTGHWGAIRTLSTTPGNSYPTDVTMSPRGRALVVFSEADAPTLDVETRMISRHGRLGPVRYFAIPPGRFTACPDGSFVNSGQVGRYAWVLDRITSRGKVRTSHLHAGKADLVGVAPLVCDSHSNVHAAFLTDHPKLDSTTPRNRVWVRTWHRDESFGHVHAVVAKRRVLDGVRLSCDARGDCVVLWALRPDPQRGAPQRVRRVTAGGHLGPIHPLPRAHIEYSPASGSYLPPLLNVVSAPSGRTMVMWAHGGTASLHPSEYASVMDPDGSLSRPHLVSRRGTLLVGGLTVTRSARFRAVLVHGDVVLRTGP